MKKHQRHKEHKEHKEQPIYSKYGITRGKYIANTIEELLVIILVTILFLLYCIAELIWNIGSRIKAFIVE